MFLFVPIVSPFRTIDQSERSRSETSLLHYRSPQMARGAFIVFEGADRSGKTTQTKRCVAALRESNIALEPDSPWRFPDRTTPIGQVINAYLSQTTELSSHAQHLLFSANRWEKAARLREALARGETVVADRYAFSGVAYSAANGLDEAWCRAADAGLPAPDLVVYLQLGVERIAERGGFGAERYENVAMQRKVAEQFRALQSTTWQVVDADADEDTVFARVMCAVRATMECDRGAVGALWAGHEK